MPPKKAAQQPPLPVDEDDDELALWNNDIGPRRAAPIAASSSDTTSSDHESLDSATRRAHEAAARVQDFGDISSAVGAAPAALPSVAAAFDAAGTGLPAFLDPEALRQLPLPETLGSDRAAAIPISATNSGLNKRGQTAGTWDISMMAPKLQGAAAPEGAGVVSGKAVRYKGGEEGGGHGGGSITAAQVAMLGGTLGSGPSSVSGSGREARERGKASKAMPVDEFLEKGVGGAQLPRKRQERKDREKDKRLKGQSTHAEWKSEAEMALRQQYD